MNRNRKNTARTTARPATRRHAAPKKDSNWTPQTWIALAAVITPAVIEVASKTADVILALHGQG